MSTSPPKSNQLEGRTLGNYPRPHAWMPVPSCKAVLSSPCILAQLHKIPPAIAAIVKYCFTATLLLVLTASVKRHLLLVTRLPGYPRSLPVRPPVGIVDPGERTQGNNSNLNLDAVFEKILWLG